MKYNIYVIKSLKNNKRYVGMTSKDVSSRLEEHNNGVNKFTKNNRPFKLIYFETDYCKDCALKREKFLKSGKGRALLDIIENAGSSNQFPPEADQPMAEARAQRSGR